MDLLKRLNEVNDVEIIGCHDPRFAKYGRLLTGYDTSMIIDYMERFTPIPREGNVYIASDYEMEKLPLIEEMSMVVYGSEEVQAGYCNGRNDTYNGFEYHKDIEVNICVTDLMLVLAKTSDLKDNTITADSAKVFFFPRGTVIEMYGDTMHLSPLRVSDAGFRAVVILPKGTNTPLTQAEAIMRNKKISEGDTEARLLLQRRKWVVAHPDRKALIEQGAYPGLLGENKRLVY